MTFQSQTSVCGKLTAAKIPFAGGGSGFLATAGATFFSGTGFLGGTVTKDSRVYTLEAAKTNERKTAQAARTGGPEGQGRERQGS